MGSAVTVALTDRDRGLIRAAWSLGYATHAALRALVSPQTAADTLRRRLRQLHRAGYLTQLRLIGSAGHIWLYGAGRKALITGEPRPWRPSLVQADHTIAVADVLVSMTRPGFAQPLAITGWQGEAELRAWAQPGWPYPDARVTWRIGALRGAWLIEVDRATESRAAWRRKLVRYLSLPTDETVLAVTTSEPRAARIAAVAADVGVPLLATTQRAVTVGLDPPVFESDGPSPTVLSAATRRVLPLVASRAYAPPSARGS